MRNTYHRDGTVTYWSVYNQCWERRVRLLPFLELRAMSKEDRGRIIRHLEKAWDRLHPGEEP